PHLMYQPMPQGGPSPMTMRDPGPAWTPPMIAEENPSMALPPYGMDDMDMGMPIVPEAQRPQRVKLTNPAIVCRHAGCTELNDKITGNALLNALINLFNNNVGTKAYTCTADPASRTCLADFIGYRMQVGGTPTH